MTNLLTSAKRWLLLSAAACAWPLAGCGGSGPPTVPVYGKVTFGGGAPPAAGVLAFAPIDVAAGLPRRPGYAPFDTDGAFRATSFKSGDGLIPGRYGVTITCQKPAPDDRVDPQQFSYVQRGYQAPELVVEVNADEVKVDFDVPLNPLSP